MSGNGKFIFWSSVPVTNLRNAGKVAAFRNNVFRTDDAAFAEYITENFVKRNLANLVIEKVDEAGLKSRLLQKAKDAAPASPDEGKIEALPNQTTTVPPPIPTTEPAVPAALTTGMQGSIPTTGADKK
jgi:hypothetical protein